MSYFKEITITNRHPEYAGSEPPGKLTLKLEGGCPWYAYIWIDGECYYLTRQGNGRVYKLTKSS